jgi:hypothetical protein
LDLICRAHQVAVFLKTWPTYSLINYKCINRLLMLLHCWSAGCWRWIWVFR